MWISLSVNVRIMTTPIRGIISKAVKKQEKNFNTYAITQHVTRLAADIKGFHKASPPHTHLTIK